MELRDYLRALRRNWALIAAGVLIGLLAASVYAFTVTPTYISQTRLFAATQSSDSIAELQQGSSFTQARVQSYAETANTPLVLQPVIDSLGLEMTPANLAESIEATADPNTVLLTITAKNSSPVQAAAIAQSVADSLVRAIEELETTSSDGDSPVKLSVVTPATAPTDPASPNVGLSLGLGLLLGLTGGVSVAILRTISDTKVRGEADIRRFSEAPVLGGITFDADATKKPLLTQAPPQSPRAESFRQLRTNLQFAHIGRDAKSVVVTSSLPGEGKSTTAVNLAIAIAQSGQSVVLVDADLRRPRVGDYLGLERSAGLTTALMGRAEVADLLQPWGDNELYVLTSGQIPPNPSELLGSRRMMELIAELEKTFDAVIFDAPPLLPVTDAAVLSQRVGGVVMVIGASKVKIPDVQKSLGALELVDADLLGVVMNLLPTKGADAYSYSYYAAHDVETSPPRMGSRSSDPGVAAVESDFDERVLRGSRTVSRGSRS